MEEGDTARAKRDRLGDGDSDGHTYCTNERNGGMIDRSGHPAGVFLGSIVTLFVSRDSNRDRVPFSREKRYACISMHACSCSCCWVEDR
ncbi:hypothetical protein BDA96_03G448500 [Sorghum bicolor]|uniref:Uncharacterized protein n=1 Tax=Sorghum bicolor TaxID=4558 RepID=A0A921RJE0_SORBI|nr:hypothetical protein BDA96_03G448500 [Sorghum bicolor]